MGEDFCSSATGPEAEQRESNTEVDRKIKTKQVGGFPVVVDVGEDLPAPSSCVTRPGALPRVLAVKAPHWRHL